MALLLCGSSGDGLASLKVSVPDLERLATRIGVELRGVVRERRA
jgi:hypothetical protein